MLPSRLARQLAPVGALQAARLLLGATLRHQSPAGWVGGTIVEVEAYDASEPASHSHRGQTPRNRSMFGRAGTAYVYRAYGLHWCLNVVCGAEGHGAAVLLRALLPRWGLEQMAARRRRADGAPLKSWQLARGPGCLTLALGVDRSQDGCSLASGPLQLRLPEQPVPDAQVVATPRIGIRQAVALPWRLAVRDSLAVSGSRAALRLG